MTRPFRPYGKKRGNRRTGSRQLGRAGQVAFFAVSFFVGCLLLGWIATQTVMPQWQINQNWLESTCTLKEKRVAERTITTGVEYYPEFRVYYEVGGKSYREWTYANAYPCGPEQAKARAILDQFQEGESYVCWYDPIDPAQVTVVRAYTWSRWILLLLPASFIILGGGGLLYLVFSWGKSQERRAAITKKAAELDLFDAHSQNGQYPTVPLDSNLTNSPGTTLAYRLPALALPAWPLVVALALALAAVGLSAGFAVMVVRGHLWQRPDWPFTGFTIGLAAVAVAAAVHFVRRFLAATGAGPTLLEISGHPLVPGRTYELYLSQAGRQRFRSLRVLFVCEEEAAFLRGTNTRIDRRRVFEDEVFSRRDFEVRPAAPLEMHCEVLVPPRAMHSFKSEHNRVRWKLVVEARIDDRRAFDRDFPVVVVPSPGPKS